MAINLEFPKPYFPSLEAALCDRDNAEEEMELAASFFHTCCIDEKLEAANRFQATRERYHIARETVWAVKFPELYRRMERGGK